jgi:glycosyltransferase involved in cell wall biosynthesis
MFIVIPCFNEPDILTTLNSLAACYPPRAEVSVLVVVNDSDDVPEQVITQNIQH